MASKMIMGDKVQYSNSFLRKILGDANVAARKGIVETNGIVVGKSEYVKVLWNDGQVTGALTCNLQKIGEDK